MVTMGVDPPNNCLEVQLWTKCNETYYHVSGSLSDFDNSPIAESTFAKPDNCKIPGFQKREEQKEIFDKLCLMLKILDE